MGISAQGWTLGELVHTDSWGEDGKAQGSLGVQRAFTIAPSPAESQVPDSNTWLGGICGDISFRLSLLPSLYNPSHSLSECLSAIHPAQKQPETFQASVWPQLICICSFASIDLIRNHALLSFVFTHCCI